MNCVHFQLAMLAYNLNCWLLLFNHFQSHPSRLFSEIREREISMSFRASYSLLQNSRLNPVIAADS
jgi:hypothetical protein